MNDYFDGYKEHLLTVKKTSKNTFDAYVRDVLQFLYYCESQKLADTNSISREFIEEYIVYLKKIGKSDATKTRVIASIKGYLRYLKSINAIETNPSDGIINPRTPKKLPGVLTAKEVINLLDMPGDRDYKSIRDRAMLELLYATGIRVSELIGLSVNDVNVQIGILNLQSEKSSRIIPIYPKAAKHLAEYINNVRPALIEGIDEDKLFTNMNGRPLSRQGCWKIIKYYADKAGIEGDITPQTLRHSFATHLLENGAQLKDIKEMLGHSDISSTQVYANIIKNKFVQNYSKYHPLAGK